MAFNLAAADAILKDFYLGPVRGQLNQATPVLAELNKTEENVVGKRVYLPTHLGRSEAIGARADGGTLPTVGSGQDYEESVFNVKYQYGRIDITLPTIKASATDRGAFLRAVDAETKGILTELKEDVDRQICRNGKFGGTAEGVLATTTDGASSATTFTLKDPDDVTYRVIRPGMVIDVADASGTILTNGTGRVISAVNTSTGAVTMGSAGGFTDPGGALDTVVDGRIYRTASKNNELNGIPGIAADTGALQGLNPATAGQEAWKGTVVANGGVNRPLSEDLLQQLLDKVAASSGEEPSHFLVEYTQRRKFYALMSSMKRAVNTVDLKGGFKTLTFNDSIPFLVDRFADVGKIHAINTRHLALYQMSDWEWADDDGSVLSRVANSASFEAFLYKFCELGTDKRNTNGTLSDLNT